MPRIRGIRIKSAGKYTAYTKTHFLGGHGWNFVATRVGPKRTFGVNRAHSPSALSPPPWRKRRNGARRAEDVGFCSKSRWRRVSRRALCESNVAAGDWLARFRWTGPQMSVSTARGQGRDRNIRSRCRARPSAIRSRTNISRAISFSRRTKIRRISPRRVLVLEQGKSPFVLD
jgi:hypothetical protein